MLESTVLLKSLHTLPLSLILSLHDNNTGLSGGDVVSTSVKTDIITHNAAITAIAWSQYIANTEYGCLKIETKVHLLSTDTMVKKFTNAI